MAIAAVLGGFSAFVIKELVTDKVRQGRCGRRDPPACDRLTPLQVDAPTNAAGSSSGSAWSGAFVRSRHNDIARMETARLANENMHGTEYKLALARTRQARTVDADAGCCWRGR